MKHECAISDMLGDICAADHVVKIPLTFTLCSSMTANWRCTMEGLLVLLVCVIICFTCCFLGDGQWKYYKQENAHTVSVLSHTAKDYDNVHSLYPPPLSPFFHLSSIVHPSIFSSFLLLSAIFSLLLPPPIISSQLGCNAVSWAPAVNPGSLVEVPC